MTSMTNKSFKYLMAAVMLAVSVPGLAQSGTKERSVYTNGFKDNWELSFGLEGLSFYSGRESGLGLSKSPFKSYRATFGAAATVGKWFTPEIGLRTKGSGYWGKAVLSDDAEANDIRFYTVQEQIMVNITNLILGYSPDRKYNMIPYAGAGLVRDVTHNENSIGAGVGINNTLNIGQHLMLHFDIGIQVAGNKYIEDRDVNIMGNFKWIGVDLGLTFKLGKSYWSNKAKRGGQSERNIATVGDYNNIKRSNQEDVNTQKVLAQGEVPDGMVLINRGHLRMGMENEDSIWGRNIPVRDISVDDFWMDKTEVTNEQYRLFIKDVMDSIIAQRMEDPYYLGNRERVIESLYITNPVTGEKRIDGRQLNYCYEVYDYAEEMKRKNRLDPYERQLNTDIVVNPDEVVMISKDTAYVDDNGRIVRETIERPLTGPFDFLNTYIVNIYPDTTCWVNDFPNSDNEMYSRYYFSHPDYKDYPVVGVTWEQANAYCAWRTERMRNQLQDTPRGIYQQRFRLPTEAEWEYAARGKSQNEFPWDKQLDGQGEGMFYANFMPDDGNFTKDGNIITSRVGVYPKNTNGLYDMAGNVAEWTSTAYTAAGVEAMNAINPELKYNAAIEDPYRLKKKSVRGGSWKDSESHIKAAWRQAEYQNQPRSYIGFRCVRSLATTPSEKTVLVIDKKKK